MDLFFQGRAWLNKGLSPNNVAQARDFFDRALSEDPHNFEALVASARVDFYAGSLFFAADPSAALLAAEAKVVKALSAIPDHARGHSTLGYVYLWTDRAAEGIAECEHALALDRNLALAHAAIGWGKMLIGRAEQTEAHVAEALRLSPRDTLAYAWLNYVAASKSHLGAYEQAVSWHRRSIESNRNFPPAHFWMAAALALLGRLKEAAAAAEASRALNPTFNVSRARALWTAMSDDPKYLAGLEPIFEGLRLAGVPEQ